MNATPAGLPANSDGTGTMGGARGRPGEGGQATAPWWGAGAQGGAATTKRTRSTEQQGRMMRGVGGNPNGSSDSAEIRERIPTLTEACHPNDQRALNGAAAETRQPTGRQAVCRDLS